MTAILIELRGSEAKFVDDLQQTIERFIHPMEAGGILSPSDVDALFSNMKSLILTHRAMLDALPAVSLDGEAVALSVLAEQAATTARSFVALAPFLQMHAVYAANYEDHAHDALSRLQKQSAFAKFCAAAEVSGASLPDGSVRYIRANTQRGMSDIMGTLNDGRTLAIEVKSRTGRMRPGQEEFLASIRAAGGVAGVCRSVEDALKLLGDA